jgi:hypothetical protein
MQTIRSPLKPNDTYTSRAISPNRSQSNSKGYHFNRKQSVKKGLLQIEIEKQNKENRPVLNMVSSTPSDRYKPTTNILAKVFKGERSPRLSRSPVTPTKNINKDFEANLPNMTNFVRGGKLSFKNIYSTNDENHPRRELNKSPGNIRPQNSEYLMRIPTIDSGKHTSPILQISFAKQLSI